MRKILLPLFALTVVTSCNKSAPEKTVSEIQEMPPNFSAAPESVENLLNTPQEINFGGDVFKLAWSSHPSEIYYKQEYIPAGNTLERYKQMVGVELVTGEVSAEDAAARKIQEIEARKATDRVANYAVKEDKDTGEIVLDFLLSEGTEDSMIMEWNIYRYKDYKAPDGTKGLSLFSLSRRGYGREIATFGPDIRDNRKKYMEDFIALERPNISLER